MIWILIVVGAIGILPLIALLLDEEVVWELPGREFE